MKTLLFLAAVFLLNSLYAFDSEIKAPLVFTVEETQWLKEHAEIRVASDPDFPLVEWLDDNNQFQGVAIDYLRILEKKLPVKFIPVRKKSWSDILQGMKDQKIDLIFQPAYHPRVNRIELLWKQLHDTVIRNH